MRPRLLPRSREWAAHTPDDIETVRLEATVTYWQDKQGVTEISDQIDSLRRPEAARTMAVSVITTSTSLASATSAPG